MFKNITRNFTVLSLLFSMCMPCAFSSANQAEEICVEQDNLATQQTEEGQKQKKLNEMAIDLFSMMFGGSREKAMETICFFTGQCEQPDFLSSEDKSEANSVEVENDILERAAA